MLSERLMKKVFSVSLILISDVRAILFFCKFKTKLNVMFERYAT